MTRMPLKSMATALLLVSLAWSQENTIGNVDWAKIRMAFEAYVGRASTENAEGVLAVLPDGYGFQIGDPKEHIAALRYIFGGRSFRKLSKLVRKGDRFALRIAFRTLRLSSGGEDARVCILLGKSIPAHPVLFLEEFRASVLDPAWLDLIVTGYGWADEGYPELSDKEIRLRLISLRSIDRPDLADIRDICVRRLSKELEYRRRP